MYNVTLSANRDRSTCSDLDAFISFSCLIALAGLQDCGECKQHEWASLCLVPYLKNKAPSVSPLRLMLANGSFAKSVRTTKLAQIYFRGNCSICNCRYVVFLERK